MLFQLKKTSFSLFSSPAQPTYPLSSFSPARPISTPPSKPTPPSPSPLSPPGGPRKPGSSPTSGALLPVPQACPIALLPEPARLPPSLCPSMLGYEPTQSPRLPSSSASNGCHHLGLHGRPLEFHRLPCLRPSLSPSLGLY